MASTKRFCDICDSIAILSTLTGELVFICSACKNQVKGGPEDTLIRTDVSITPNDLDEVLIEFGRYDKCNPLEYKPCPKCKKTDYMRFIRSRDTLKKIYLCPLCDYTETS